MKDQIPLFPDYKDKKPTDKTLLNDGNAGGEINPAKKSKQSKIDKAKSDAFVIKTLKKYFLKNSNDNDDLF
ncbi:MAG: hypothetical protein QM532_03645, partial [Cyanobium sp. MAG06]|nr:hypothetical protein [Cyanobium sp. MAG06]